MNQESTSLPTPSEPTPAPTPEIPSPPPSNEPSPTTPDLGRLKMHLHFARMEQQAMQLQKEFADFDLAAELGNPLFLRLTSPAVGLSVEDAYHTVHRKQIRENDRRLAAEEAVQKYANAIRSGSTRPTENGAAAKGPSLHTPLYSHASRAERNALKQRIRLAAAKGEKVYPGK